MKKYLNIKLKTSDNGSLIISLKFLLAKIKDLFILYFLQFT